VVLTCLCHQVWRPVTVGRAFWPLRGAAPGRVLEGDRGSESSVEQHIHDLGYHRSRRSGGWAGCVRYAQHERPPVAAAPTGAAEVPVRVQPNAAGWSGMVQRPDHIYVGMGGAPIARQLAWRNWGGPRAWAAGKLDIYLPQPGPISGWHPVTYTVTVRLQDIVTHNGQRSYRKMADFYVNRRGVAKVLHFTFYVLPGGSVPAWNPGQARNGQRSIKDSRGSGKFELEACPGPRPPRTGCTTTCVPRPSTGRGR
jgi:hypothetical protein